jgi:hypothetical protein
MVEDFEIPRIARAVPVKISGLRVAASIPKKESNS